MSDTDVQPDDYGAWRRERKARPVHVYLLSCGPYVKVGIAADVRARLMELQVGNPLRIVEVWKSAKISRDAARRVERRAHRHLKANLACGEWFETSVEVAMAAIMGVWSS